MKSDSSKSAMAGVQRPNSFLSSKRKSIFKKIVIAGIFALAIGSSIAWYIFTEKFSDTSERKAAFTVTANDFIKEFQQSDSLANKKYTEKIVVVNGIVSEVENADSTTNIKFVDTATGSYIIFAFQDMHLQEAKQLKPGDNASIKGSCSGGTYSDILEVNYITFKRCAINK
jgi:tRNA_anti-like